MRPMLFTSLLALSLFTGWAAAADDSPFDCDDPVHSGPRVVKLTLGKLYRIEPTVDELNVASADLKALISAATFCRIKAQSPLAGGSQSLTREWFALQMWLNRIADTVYHNARGRTHVDWKREYADFAEIYEIEG